ADRDYIYNIFNSMPQYVAVVSEDFRYEFINIAMLKLLEFVGQKIDLQPMIGMPCYTFTGSENRCAYCPIPRLLSRKDIKSAVYQHEIFGRILEGVATKLKNLDDSVSILVFMQDVTDQRELGHSLQKSELRFKALFDESPVSIMIHDKDTGEIIDANEAAYKAYGFDSLARLQENEIWLPPPYSRKEALDWIHKAASIGTQQFVWMNRKVSGEIFWEHVTLRAIRLGDMDRVMATSIDITERKRAEQQLHESEERLRGITESTRDAIIMMDPKGAISFWNPAAETILGYRSEEAIGRDLHELLAPKRYLEAFRAAFPPFRKTGRGNAIGKTVEMSAIQKKGHEIIISLTLSAVFLQGEWHAAGVIRDVTEHRKMQEDLAKMASVDELTGLFNRRVFMEYLEHEVSRFKRYKKTAIVMMLDLDHFKKINDTHGHAAGDMVLRQFGGLLKATVRETDISGRVGGEEFALLLPETTLDDAMLLAKRILKNVRESVVATVAGDVRYTTSIGFAELQQDDTHIDQLMARADAALYRAKNKGRNRVEMGSSKQKEEFSGVGDQNDGSGPQKD
ncbi:MAG: diguanylate cyclase, partial [Thermodesulfobacteriota bacterium]